MDRWLKTASLKEKYPSVLSAEAATYNSNNPEQTSLGDIDVVTMEAGDEAEKSTSTSVNISK
jgi:hypothetical protein